MACSSGIWDSSLTVVPENVVTQDVGKDLRSLTEPLRSL